MRIITGNEPVSSVTPAYRSGLAFWGSGGDEHQWLQALFAPLEGTGGLAASYPILPALEKAQKNMPDSRESSVVRAAASTINDCFLSLKRPIMKKR
ncbi:MULTISPECIES: hypothetical protein [Pannonibacter]|uniref:hypothetical protein n=1 Tax=Pannonibacter TaxID=227873 RepID=UPI0012FD8EFD|nr:hypothetical protein [Pannonibacter phragmitetus]